MTDLPSVDTIVEDIEFELLLGTVPSGELSQAFAAIRREQNRLRREYAGSRRRVDARAVAGELLRLNDRVLDLLQEALSRLTSVELVIDSAAGRVPAAAREDTEPPSEAVVASERAEASGAPALHPDIGLDVRPMSLPVAGRLVDRFRLALHQVALYYVRSLAGQQGAVNVYHAGELERLDHLVRDQQRRLAELETELAELRAKVSTGESEEKVGPEDA